MAYAKYPLVKIEVIMGAPSDFFLKNGTLPVIIRNLILSIS